MAIIQFKRGTTGPEGLTLGEPAWDYANNKFYIGSTSGSVLINSTPLSGSGFTLLESISFTTSQTYTLPTGSKLIFGKCIGAGGGGAAGGISGQNRGAGGGGGAGGAYFEFLYDVSTYPIGATVAVTIGSGGTGGTASASSTTVAGGNGGFSIFDIHEFPGGFGGGLNEDRSFGYFVPAIARTSTFTSHFAGSGGQRRAAANNVGLNATIGWKGGAGGGGGAGTTGAGTANAGGQGAQSTDRISLAISQLTTAISFATSGATSGAGGRGEGATLSVPATIGLDGDNRVGGGGGGGGASNAVGDAVGNGATGGYPGGGGGGGGGNIGLTGNNGGRGGNARIQIWVYG